MTVITVDFMKGREAEHQRYVRRVVRKIPRNDLTRSTRDILLFLVNLWFYHKNGPKGYIHPSAQRTAKKTGYSIVTAKRALAVLREKSIIKAVGYIKGGAGMATRYTVDIDMILETYAPHGVVTLDGELVAFPLSVGVQNDTVFAPENDTVGAYQNDTLYITPFDMIEDQAKDAKYE